MAGRRTSGSGTAAPRPYERSASEFPEYDRPGRFAAANPEADDEFLRKVRERAEEQRRLDRERKAAEREAEGRPADDPGGMEPDPEPDKGQPAG